MRLKPAYHCFIGAIIFICNKSNESDVRGICMPTISTCISCLVVLNQAQKWVIPTWSFSVGAAFEMIQQVCNIFMTTKSLQTLRDCPLLTFAYSFTVLSESPVLSLPAIKVCVQSQGAFARCSIWKTLVAEKEHLITYHRKTETNFPINHFELYLPHWFRKPLFFVLQDSPNWDTQDLTCYVKLTFEHTGLTTPSEETFWF